MTAKEYLGTIRRNENLIHAWKKELKRIKAESVYLSAVRYDRDVVQTSGNHDGMKRSDIIADLERSIGRMVAQLTLERNRIIDEIGQLDNPLYVDILLLRYVQLISFDNIAALVNLSYSRTAHLHGEALEAFANKFLRPAKDSKK